MSGSGEQELGPALAQALGSFGCGTDQAAIREQLSAAARGTNLVIAAPPAARYAAAALGGLLHALTTSDALALVLAPPHALTEWSAVLLPLANAARLTALCASQPGWATRRLREGRLRVLLTTPSTALALLERSALKPDVLRHVVLVWPEQYPADDALTALMQDLAADAQRIVIPAAPAEAHPVVERYARRALVAGPLASPDAALPPKGAVRSALVSWSGRGTALAALIEAEDPDSLAVWCADPRSAVEARAALPVGDPAVVAVGPEITPAQLVVAWDLPGPAQLAALRAAGDVVLLVPPHAADYVSRVTSRQTPVRLRGAADEARDQAGRRRLAIAAEIERGNLDGALLALAPLFERHDPARVAAALYRLGLSGPEAAAPPAVEAAGGIARVWVGVGRKEGAGPADLVAALTRDVGVEASRIGRIEIRELFSLVEVPAAEAEEIARGLSGKTIRRRQVVAKVDRGRPSDGSRGPSGPSRRGRPAPRKP
jgi:ATP-dependent RNA helicase DeaD